MADKVLIAKLRELIGKWDSEVPAREDETTLLLILQKITQILAGEEYPRPAEAPR